jgi:PAS domain S-box-containing protein
MNPNMIKGTMIDERSPVLSAWREVIETGAIDTNALRPEIAASWKRCRKAGVAPLAAGSKQTSSQSQLDVLLKTHKDMIDIAKPFMESLYRIVADSRFVVLLSDADGVIMETIGDRDIIRSATDIDFRRGASWNELRVGTNGIGTTLVMGAPFQVSGAEHYCKKHHPWTCSGAPIFDDAGHMIGALEMSGPVEETHLHTLGMVVAAVEAIRQQMQNLKKNRELTLLSNHLRNMFLTVSDGVISINRRGAITQINPVAEKILGRTRGEIEAYPITDLFGACEPIRQMLDAGRKFSDVEISVNTESGHAATVASGKPIKDAQGRVTGGVVFINPITKIKNLINRFSGAQATFCFTDIIGKSAPLQKAIELARLAAGNTSNVLLCGESGTGKEIFAQSIHNHSSRRHGPFIAVNCGAIPRELIGSELFGYVDGAFTGARKGGRPGKFELASGGTLFLDEIGDMPLVQQVSLLRVIQNKRVTRIGGATSAMMDVRIICATNKNLIAEIAKGNFRQDIYYRLNVINILLPPLRERREDIASMFAVFFKRACSKLGIAIPNVNPAVVEYLQQYDWPGNAREFQNVVERMVNIANGREIGIAHLPDEIIALPPHRPDSDIARQSMGSMIAHEKIRIKAMLAEKQRQEILNLMQKNSGNLSQVARDMGIARNSLYRKLKKLAMQ